MDVTDRGGLTDEVDDRFAVADRNARIRLVQSTADLVQLPRWEPDGVTFYLLLPVTGPTEVRTEGGQIQVRPDSCLLIRPEQATSIRVADHSQLVALSFPATIVDLSLSSLGAVAGAPIDVTSGVAAAFASLLRSLASATGIRATQTALHVSDAVTSLLTATLLEAGAGSDGTPRADAALLAAKRWIEEHLADVDLGVAAVAAAGHLSVSYLQKLFAADGHSVSGWIRERRCERCRRDLADPALQDLTIAAIAELWGFVSPPHFTRVFTRYYGLSPRQYRAAALRGHD